MKNQSPHLSVAAIEHGTVLDHITPGKAQILLRLFKLESTTAQITIGLNLPSSHFKSKDIIKITNWELSPKEAAQIAVFSPNATVNIIKDFQVVSKFPVVLPETLEGVLRCPNRNCITNHEAAGPFFYITTLRKSILFTCKYCEKVFQNQELSLLI